MDFVTAPDKQGDLIKVDLDRLATDSPLGFDLYTIGQKVGPRIMVRGGEVFRPEVKRQFIRAKINLHVTRAQSELYYDHLAKQLKILIDPAVTPPQKSMEVVHELAGRVMRDLFENPSQNNMIRARQVISATSDLIIQSDEALHHLLVLAEHDQSSYTHSINVGVFGLGLIKTIFKGVSAFDYSALGLALFFHDIGKTTIDTGILNKPDRLTPKEFEVIRSHSRAGLQMLKNWGILSDEARYIVYQHHERPDGTGYPAGLTGKDIHPMAKICAVVDAFDALTSDRPYRSRVDAYEALSIMTTEMSEIFDQSLVQKFIMMFR